MNETIITWNGVTLTVAQAMTVYAALNSICFEEDNALGEDDTGLAIQAAYKRCAREILSL